MKKILCVLLSSVLFISSMMLSPAVCNAADDENSPMQVKLTKARQLDELYGESLLTDIENLGSWNFEYPDESISLDEVTTNINDSSSEIQWGTSKDTGVTAKNHPYGTHGYIIKKANDSSESGNRIPDKYINLVYEIAKRSDTEYGANKDDFCSALHSNGNYIANIAYLWKLTRLIGANKGSVTNPTDANIKAFITQMGNQAYNDIPKSKLSDDAKEKLDGLHSTVPKVLKKYYKTTSIASSSGQTWPGRCKYILYGLVSHMVGDVFAHRVLLKTNAADYLKNAEISFNSSTMLDRSFFTIKYFNVDGLVDDVKAGNLVITGLKTYVLENLGDDTIKEKQSLAHKNYADNPTFYPKRINEAICALSFFFDTYPDVSSISKIIDYSDTCVTPVEGFELRNFTAYERQLEITS